MTPGAEAIVPGVKRDFALLGAEAGPGEEREHLGGLFLGPGRLGGHGRGEELRGRASPAEGGSGRRGVRALREGGRRGGLSTMVGGSLGLPSLGGEEGRWGGPPSAVGESSGRVSLAVEGGDEEGGRSG